MTDFEAFNFEVSRKTKMRNITIKCIKFNTMMFKKYDADNASALIVKNPS
jgi:hypothetical protein